MLEFEQDFPDWRIQVESAIYYPGRKGDVNTSGKQFEVYTTPGIDFVVKVPRLPRWLDGYSLVEDNSPECAIPFVRARNLRLNIDRIKSTVPEAIVQKKVVDLIAEVGNIYKTRDFKQYQRLVSGLMEADRKMFEAGLFVPDPVLMNFGLNGDSEVRTLDFGSARQSLRDDEEYSNLARARGHAHYGTFFALQIMEGHLDFVSTEPELPSNVYFEFMQLPPAHPRGSNVDGIIQGQDGNEWNSDLSMFLAEIGHQEFIDHSPIGAPFGLNEEFIRGLPKSLRSKEGDDFF